MSIITHIKILSACRAACHRAEGEVLELGKDIEHQDALSLITMGRAMAHIPETDTGAKDKQPMDKTIKDDTNPTHAPDPVADVSADQAQSVGLQPRTVGKDTNK